jgi:hypothetical protein
MSQHLVDIHLAPSGCTGLIERIDSANQFRARGLVEYGFHVVRAPSQGTLLRVTPKVRSLKENRL